MVWALVVPYVLLSLAAWRMLAGHYAWKFAREDGKRRPDEWWDACSGSFFIVLLWPLSLLAFVLVLIGLRWPLVIGEERRAQRRADEQRIERLEQELDLR